mgnify:FL=1
MAAEAVEPRSTAKEARMSTATSDLVPPITDEERAAALAVLERFEALDLAPMLGLDDEGDDDE